MNVHETNLGFEIKTDKFVLLFGGVNAQIPQLQAQYPEFDFIRVKQIHSDAVVESNDMACDFQVIADAHFTHKKALALCINTADCVPAFVYDKKKHLAAGIHAGWRGVANRIIPKTLQQLISQGSQIEDLEIIIGPHIQKSSFEVEFDVRDQIIGSLGPLSPEDKSTLTEKISDNKALVDLNQIVKIQLMNEGVQADQVFDLHLDTVTDPRFHSYRRDKQKSGRQVSFIVLR